MNKIVNVEVIRVNGRHHTSDIGKVDVFPLPMTSANGLVFRWKSLEYNVFVLSLCRTLWWVARVQAVAAAVHDVEAFVGVLY